MPWLPGFKLHDHEKTYWPRIGGFLFAFLREIFSTDRTTHAKFSRWRTVRMSEIDISIWWIGGQIAPLCWIVIAAVGYASPRCDKGPPGKAAPSLD